MEEEIKEFLSNIGFYPVAKENWKVFTINHCKPDTEEEIKKTHKYMDSHVKGINGIYVYKNTNGEVLYIGKGKPIINRLKSHYWRSFGEPRDPKDRSYHFTIFFSSNQGDVEIYYKELEDEDNRVLVENLLQRIYKPKFLGKKSKLT